MINNISTIAVVGASSDTQKYGYKVFKHFLDLGIKVFPVNRKGGTILGKKAFSSLSDIPGEIDLVIMVVPPQISEQVVKEIVSLNIEKVWFQPGSESVKAVEYCHDNGVLTQTDSCIMLQ